MKQMDNEEDFGIIDTVVNIWTPEAQNTGLIGGPIFLLASWVSTKTLLMECRLNNCLRKWMTPKLKKHF